MNGWLERSERRDGAKRKVTGGEQPTLGGHRYKKEADLLVSLVILFDVSDGLLDDAELAEESLWLRVVAAEVAVEDCLVLAAAL